MYYIDNVVTADEEATLLKETDACSWIDLKRRRLQQYGGQPDPEGMVLMGLPDHIQGIVDRVMAVGAFDPHQRPNHVLVNQYRSGEG